MALEWRLVREQGPDLVASSCVRGHNVPEGDGIGRVGSRIQTGGVSEGCQKSVRRVSEWESEGCQKGCQHRVRRLTHTPREDALLRGESLRLDGGVGEVVLCKQARGAMKLHVTSSQHVVKGCRTVTYT
jgi:hypothetical protein